MLFAECNRVLTKYSGENINVLRGWKGDDARNFRKMGIASAQIYFVNLVRSFSKSGVICIKFVDFRSSLLEINEQASKNRNRATGYELVFN